MCKQTSIKIAIAVDLAVGILIFIACKIKNKKKFQRENLIFSGHSHYREESWPIKVGTAFRNHN